MRTPPPKPGETPVHFGDGVSNLGDLDADGVTDLAVGASRDDEGATDTGAAWILLLQSDGTVKSETQIGAATPALVGLLSGSDFFGVDVQGIGDLDGDGRPDLAVGAEVLAKTPR